MSSLSPFPGGWGTDYPGTYKLLGHPPFFSFLDILGIFLLKWANISRLKYTHSQGQYHPSYGLLHGSEKARALVIMSQLEVKHLFVSYQNDDYNTFFFFTDRRYFRKEYIFKCVDVPT